MHINAHITHLSANYLFTEIATRTKAFHRSHPEAHILRMGIGDVHGPMTPDVLHSLHAAVDDQATTDRFRGYGVEYGERWLRERIADFCYRPLHISLTPDEIFISDGAGSDLGNLSDIFASDNRVAIFDPVYPEYYDTSVMAGRQVVLLPATPDNHFAPLPNDSEQYDIIYLCSPGNPTGTALTRSQVQSWVDYANRHQSVIIFDAAYEAFVHDPDIPHSIYECTGAQTCAIEVRSFSKLAGFTGIRCGFTVVPQALLREGVSLGELWRRRQCTKFNGPSILSQKAAMAVLTDEGYAQAMERVSEYRQNALLLKQSLQSLGTPVYGADNSPYVWAQVPEGFTSWSYFDYLIEHYHIVSTPGVGFGPHGEGFFRLSGFGTHDQVSEAIQRLQKK